MHTACQPSPTLWLASFQTLQSPLSIEASPQMSSERHAQRSLTQTKLPGQNTYPRATYLTWIYQAGKKTYIMNNESFGQNWKKKSFTLALRQAYSKFPATSDWDFFETNAQKLWFLLGTWRYSWKGLCLAGFEKEQTQKVQAGRLSH